MTSATLIGQEPVKIGADVNNNIQRDSCRTSSSSLQRSNKQRSEKYARLKNSLQHSQKATETAATAPQIEVRKEIVLNSNNKTKCNTALNFIGRQITKIGKYQTDPCQINRIKPNHYYCRLPGSRNIKTKYTLVTTITETANLAPQNEVRKELKLNPNYITKFNTAPNLIGSFQQKFEKYQTEKCLINRKRISYKPNRLAGPKNVKSKHSIVKKLTTEVRNKEKHKGYIKNPNIIRYHTYQVQKESSSK